LSSASDGLISDPGDFHVSVNDLASDEEVRRRYQVWIFCYPTGLPVAYFDMLLLKDLEAFVHRLDPRGRNPALRRAVLAGHSMGGLLCRFAISGEGDRYYHHYFRERVDHLRLSTSDPRVGAASVLLPRLFRRDPWSSSLRRTAVAMRATKNCCRSGHT